MMDRVGGVGRQINVTEQSMVSSQVERLIASAGVADIDGFVGHSLTEMQGTLIFTQGHSQGNITMSVSAVHDNNHADTSVNV